MATQDRKSVGTDAQEEEYVDEVPVPPADGADAAPAAQTEGVDDLLDEIDGVLEVNAEEFVRGFVQKGGQ